MMRQSRPLAYRESRVESGRVNQDPEDVASAPPTPPDEVFEDGWIEPDPDEPPPVTLTSLVGDVQPWGTVLLVLAWGAVFLAMGARGEAGDSGALIAWGGNVTGASPLETAWRALASTFLHAGFGHVFFNALSMLLFGSTVERIYGRPGFGLLFAAGGVVASLASVAWRSGGPALSVGASGAIFALGGALLIASIRLRKVLAPGRARAFGAALLFLVGQALAAGFTRHGTDNVAHGAGLAAGLLLGMALPLDARLGGRGTGVAERAMGVLAWLALAAALAMAVLRGLVSFD
jgi:membrane associated rhomboid family serine protease